VKVVYGGGRRARGYVLPRWVAGEKGLGGYLGVSGFVGGDKGGGFLIRKAVVSPGSEKEE